MRYIKKTKILAIVTAAVFTLQPTALYASKIAITELTVAAATARAIENSTELKNLDENAYLNQKNRSNLYDSLMDATTETGIINASISLFQNEVKQLSYESNKENQKKSLEYSVTKFFSSIITAERDLALYDKNLELQKKEMAINETKAKLGLISQTTYASAKLAYEKNIANREAKVIAIENAYNSLNQIMGRNLSTRYTLILELEYEELGEINLNSHIQRSIANNANIKNLEDNVKVAKFNVDSFNSPYAGNSSYEQLQINLVQTERSLSDAKTNLETSIITNYNAIRNLETTYANNLRDYGDMEKQLEVKKAQLALGKITDLDLLNYEYQMLQLEHSILNQINDHAIRVMQFQNPNL